MHLSIPSPDPVWSQFQLGPLTIHTYALCILAGIVAAVIITQRRLSRRGAPSGIVLDVIIWAVPLGIVGGPVLSRVHPRRGLLLPRRESVGGVLHLGRR